MIRGKTTFLTALLVLLAPAAAQAQYNCLLPNLDSMYLGKDPITYGTYLQDQLAFMSAGNCVQLPALGSPTTTSFPAGGDIRLSPDGGATWGEYYAQAAITVHLVTTAQNGDDKE